MSKRTTIGLAICLIVATGVTACSTKTTDNTGRTAPPATTPPTTPPAATTPPATTNAPGAATGTPAGTVAPGTASPATGAVKEITITAKNFEFDKKEIRVKNGDKVKLTFANTEGAHGIEIPDLGVKMTAPGTTEFTVTKTGTFDYDCAVQCGPGHDRMVGKLIVE